MSFETKFTVTAQLKEDPINWDNKMIDFLPDAKTVAQELFDSGKYQCVEIWNNEADRLVKRLGKKVNLSQKDLDAYYDSLGLKFDKEPQIESICEKLERSIKLAEDEGEAKYYYIVDANYSVPGHYWNDDIKAYTPEGDRDEYDGQETSKLYTWQELLYALDDELLLTDDVPDEPPTEILKEENGNKILIEYNVEREQEWDDEEGHFEIRYYNYEVQICIKE